MSINSVHITTARLLTDESGCAEILDSLLDRNSGPAGRKPSFTSRQFLFLHFLTAAVRKDVYVSNMVDVARYLPADVLLEFGLTRNLKASRLYGYTKRLHAATDHSHARAPHLAEAEREWRRTRLDDFVDALLSYTMHRDPRDPQVYSIDATAVEVAERHRRQPKGEPIAPSSAVTDDELDIIALPPENDAELTSELMTERTSPGRGHKGPTDGTWSGKTDTGASGKMEWFFGYYAHSIATTPVTKSGSDRVQVAFFSLATARGDVVEPSLRAIDRVHNRHGIHFLAADRLYSNLKYDRWWIELDRRGIRQVLDMRKDQQGFTDFDGHLVAAGSVHCPATPRELGNIPTLPPNPSAGQRMEFQAKIQARFAYAGRAHSQFQDGKGRWECPALSGKVGCPLRGPESLQLARERGVPIITNPPEPGSEPVMCKKETVTISVRTPEQKKLFKVAQRTYWGSAEWQDLYRLRGSIERLFGHTKKHHGLSKDTHAYRGLGMATICTATIFAHANINKLRLWAATLPTPPEHPLLFSTEFEAPDLASDAEAA
jgi:hypothetical protein